MDASNNPVRAIMRPLVDGKLWMQLLGVMLIISGALQVLTIVGILWAWLPIWLGVLLFQAASAAQDAASSESPEVAARATEKLKLFFMIQGILLLIVLVVFGLFMLLGGFAMLAALGSMASSY